MTWQPAFPHARDEFTDQAVDNAERSYQKWMEQLCSAHPRLARKLHERGMLAAAPDPPAVEPGTLTPAELAVVDAYSHGLHRAEVATLLGKSESTVKGQLKAARGKLLAKTTAETCCEALRLGQIR